MRAIRALTLLLTVLSFFAVAAGIPPRRSETAAAPAPAAGPAVKLTVGRLSAPETGLRGKLLKHAAKDVGTREATGQNDGKRIEQILALAGAHKGDPYCAAAVYAWGREALGSANPFPRSAWSPDFVSQPTWIKGRGVAPRGGDAFGIWFASKSRVAHCGLVEATDGAWLITLEANTGPDGSVGEQDRNGDGIRRKRRAASLVYAVQSWLP